jgi:RES domain-containing protein
MAVPPSRLLRQLDTHRLVSSKHLPRAESVLTAIADDDRHLQEIFELDAATNDRALAERQLLPGIGLAELVSGVPHAHVINAAFCHAHPLGGRFNGPDRGAWYAAFELDTAQQEVAFHKSVQLAEIRRFQDVVTYDDYLADFSATFHDLRGRRVYRGALDPESYVESQRLANQLLGRDAIGVVYPSVRAAGGTCLACFRPAVVANVRRAKTYRFTWSGSPEPVITTARLS